MITVWSQDNVQSVTISLAVGYFHVIWMHRLGVERVTLKQLAGCAEYSIIEFARRMRLHA